MKKNKSSLFCVGIILIISLFALTACHQNTANSSNTNSSNDNISMEYVSDDVLINIAMEISKEENNYTYWLFSPKSVVSAQTANHLRTLMMTFTIR